MNLCSRETQAQLFVRDYETFYSGLEKRLDKEEYQEKIKEIHTRQAKVIPSRNNCIITSIYS